MVRWLNAMGQNSSLPKGRRKSLRSLVRRSSQKNNLSHIFTIYDNDERIELLNINTATEEELMTLPGVNRKIARNIVEHRKAIGRFRKIEDLALVSGIGAEKLELIRPEICVFNRRNQSCTSSRAPSYDSLKSSDSRLTSKSNKLINLNKASVFELQSIPGITQEVAAGIVHYRNKKGHFKKVEDLLKVKVINQVRFNNISRYFIVEDLVPSENDETPRPSILTNGYTMPNYNGIRNENFKLPATNGLTSASIIDIFELLSTYSPRPIVQEEFRCIRNGEAAVRIASWNLHHFSYDKSNNLGVREVVCRTILENGWSILAVQGVTNVTALQAVCEELNKPRLRRVDEWKCNSRNWNFCMLDTHDSKLGFIYDSDSAVGIELLSLNEGPVDTRNECEVLIATFDVCDITLRLVNMQLNKDSNIAVLNDKFREFVNEDDIVVTFVDFSNIKQLSDEHLTVGALDSIFPKILNTSYLMPKSEHHPHHVSNILHNELLKRQLTGYKGIVRQGLTHLAIPNGWSWGGPVSPYCPVWVEMYVSSNSSTAL